MTILFYFPALDAGVAHRTDATTIAVKPFETGFYPIESKSNASELNGGRYSADVLEAALAGSMFGWECPAAKPAVDYIEHAMRAGQGGAR